MRVHVANQSGQKFKLIKRSFEWTTGCFHQSRLRTNYPPLRLAPRKNISLCPTSSKLSSNSSVTMIQPDPQAYWNVNIPPDEWTIECPEYIRNQREKDVKILSTPNAEYRRLSWQEVRELIGMSPVSYLLLIALQEGGGSGFFRPFIAHSIPIVNEDLQIRKDSNRIDLFRRYPSDLRGYRKHVFYLNAEYGSVMNFVLWEKLRWQDQRPSSAEPFTNPDDLKILPNDWPYGIDEDIVHLVVWTKFKSEDDPDTGNLTPAARKQIDDFVTKTFRSKVDHENVRWFKNWASLKSIKAVEHFHVMLYKPDVNFVKEITGGAELRYDKRATNSH
ncbi:hypothetical protein MMC10_006027 [Thelotrema lepadinum]|nr:hypothetical protein [Thelotrema lepadinum]